MLRFVIEPAARDYYAQKDISFGFHQLLRVLDDPVSMVDPTGFLSERDTIVGHLMQVVHLNPIYDLQLLQMFPDGLPDLERQLEAMVAGRHPRSRTIAAIVEDPDYHARLLDYVRRYRVDPDAEPLVRQEQTLRDDERFSAAERTFATLPGFLRLLRTPPDGAGRPAPPFRHAAAVPARAREKPSRRSVLTAHVPGHPPVRSRRRATSPTKLGTGSTTAPASTVESADGQLVTGDRVEKARLPRTVHEAGELEDRALDRPGIALAGLGREELVVEVLDPHQPEVRPEQRPGREVALSGLDDRTGRDEALLVERHALHEARHRAEATVEILWIDHVVPPPAHAGAEGLGEEADPEPVVEADVGRVRGEGLRRPAVVGARSRR